jgi:hypothetical protein
MIFYDESTGNYQIVINVGPLDTKYRLYKNVSDLLSNLAHDPVYNKLVNQLEGQLANIFRIEKSRIEKYLAMKDEIESLKIKISVYQEVLTLIGKEEEFNTRRSVMTPSSKE